MEYLWIPEANEMPPELYDLYLCRNVFHCTPVELKQIPTEDLMTYISVLSAEAHVEKRRRG